MIPDEAKLNEDLWNAPHMEATRDGFGRALIELGEKDPRVVVLCADLSESTRVLEFKKRFPERFIEIGVAEQNMASIASGLANYGKIPFMASYAAFSPGRNNEQIRTTISLNDVPVKIAGMHAGVSVGPDGATHQALEDIALMRVQPRMTVISPCDSIEAYKATMAAVEIKGPVYLRMTRERTPVITAADSPFRPEQVNVVWKAKEPEVVIFATGPLLYQALFAARELEKEIATTVVNIHTIKPLDRAVWALAVEAGAVVTVEEHQIAGGLGSAIAELLAQTSPVPIEFVGVKDRFGQSGDPKELIDHYGMSSSSIVTAVRKVRDRRT